MGKGQDHETTRLHDYNTEDGSGEMEERKQEAAGVTLVVSLFPLPSSLFSLLSSSVLSVKSVVVL